MRILLRHTATGLYFQGFDRWTKKPEGAVDFKFVDRALDFIARWDLKEVEVAFAFDDPRQVIPVSAPKRAAQAVHA